MHIERIKMPKEQQAVDGETLRWRVNGIWIASLVFTQTSPRPYTVYATIHTRSFLRDLVSHQKFRTVSDAEIEVDNIIVQYLLHQE